MAKKNIGGSRTLKTLERTEHVGTWLNAWWKKFMAAVGRRTVVGRRTEVGTTTVGASVRCPVTSLAYSMPPIDSAKNVRQ